MASDLASDWQELSRWRGCIVGPVEILESIDSTNLELLRRLEAGRARPGFALLARMQEKGCGRHGRSWVSHLDRCVALSVAMPSGSTQVLSSITMLGAVCVHEVLKSLAVPDPQLKWPNDVLCRNRKLSGVLAQARSSGSTLIATVLGIGINVSQTEHEFPESLRKTAISLSMLGLRRSPPEVATRLLEELDRRLQDPGGAESWVQAWARSLGLFRGPVEIEQPDKVLRGIVQEVGVDGSIRLLPEHSGDTVTIEATKVQRLSILGSANGPRETAKQPP